MSKRQKQASAYLDLETYERITAAARRRGRSLSAHVKDLIEHDLSGIGPRQDDILDVQKAILIGVDALVRHADDKLFAVVKATRNAKIKSASDEA